MEKITQNFGQCFLLSLLFMFFSISNVQASHPPLISTGYYYDGVLRRPLLVQSLDLGTNWQYPTSFHQAPLPANFVDGGLTKTACNQGTCIATGNYYNTKLNPSPLLVQSNDLGLSWMYQDMLSMQTLPADFQKGWFDDVTCNRSLCFAVGIYENSQGPRPLLAVQEPITGLWQYSDLLSSNSVPTDFQEGHLTNISCANDFCIATGNYINNQAHRYPLLLMTKDNGATWKSAVFKDKAASAPPLDAFLFDSTCEDSFCVTVGEYSDPKTLASSLLLMQSTNKGKSWVKPKLDFPSDYESGWFSAVDCNSSFCIAVGAYNNGVTNKPILIFSKDKGRHWEYPNPPLDTIPDIQLEYGLYSSATCNDAGCIAGGYYTDWGMHPFIAVSVDKGLTWQYPASAQSSTKEAEYGNGFFGKLQCVKNNCIASGDYTIDSVYYPLLALSRDYGQTWVFPSAITNPSTLPADFINGHF